MRVVAFLVRLLVTILFLAFLGVIILYCIVTLASQ